MVQVAIGLLSGALFGQFLMQTIVSFAIMLIILRALALGKAHRDDNLIHLLVTIIQTIVFAALAYATYWIATRYIVLLPLNAGSYSAIVAFFCTLAYVGPQIGGKLLLAHMSATVPFFSADCMRVPRHQRVAFARKRQKEMQQPHEANR